MMKEGAIQEGGSGERGVSALGGMSPEVVQMSGEDYARVVREAGGRVVERGGIYWRRVRPFFYRPLLILEPWKRRGVRGPGLWPGGSQYAVEGGDGANSTLNVVVYDGREAYGLETLGHQRRRLVRNALKQFEVRRIQSATDLARDGHGVYVSFYQRTRYRYLSERQRRDSFERWVGQVMGERGAVVFGGYGREGLGAVSISYWVGRVWIYATLFAETEAMRRGVGEAMLHGMRTCAGQQTGVEHILVRGYQGGNSMDQYYLIRGATLMRCPARLEVGWPMVLGTRCFAPAAYRQLLGID